MKILYFIVALLSGFGVDVAQATSTPETAPQIILLTSIARPRLEKKLERIYLRKMKNLAKKGWKIKIKHRADAFDLHQALTNDSIDGVVWVSHGSFRMIGATRTAGGAIAAKPMLMDYRGDDVASILTLKHDRLKFLSVVGCNSKQILDYQNEPNSELNDWNELETYIPDHKVVAQWALRRASKRASHFFENKNKISRIHSKVSNTDTLEIERFIPTDAPAANLRPIRVYLANHLIGVLPPGLPGETQIARLKIPLTIESLLPLRWKIRIETGQHVETHSSKIEFGLFHFRSKHALSWKVFADDSGQPFGQNFRLYLPVDSNE